MAQTENCACGDLKKCFQRSNTRRSVTHGSFVQQGRDAEDVVVADVRHGALDDALTALQTPVALKRVPCCITVDPVEQVQLPDPGNQHQLHREGAEEEERKAQQKHRFSGTSGSFVSTDRGESEIKVHVQSR